MVQLIEEDEVELMETEKNKDGGNTPDPSADATINNVVNGHVAPNFCKTHQKTLIDRGSHSFSDQPARSP